MSTAVPRPIPVTGDHDTGPFFDAASRGELAIRVCRCGKVSHLPIAYCRYCGGCDGEWTTVFGRATVLTWTLVTHQLHPAFPTPYTVVIVSLDEHPEVHLFGHLPGAPAIHAGQRAEVWFEDVGEGVTIPQWRLLESEP